MLLTASFTIRRAGRSMLVANEEHGLEAIIAGEWRQLAGCSCHRLHMGTRAAPIPMCRCPRGSSRLGWG
jgi:hypothetical protein